MLYNLINELVTLVKTYENSSEHPTEDIFDFQNWLNGHIKSDLKKSVKEPNWEGKANGRSADSVINTSLVHLYRYSKIHSKAAIADTMFSTPDEFIYLINLVSGGSMSKTALIKQNIHEKPVGTLIINRLLSKGLIEQQSVDSDKRSKIIHITPKGLQHLKENMENIKLASANVTEPLSYVEKMELITLMLKLEDFHAVQSAGKF
ncbi:MarR family winged helix-turn-helix transcriptional regulator [Pedobacter mendelii]|uniref:HTH marR-type domain-containing protein n=1 Tax=Pedobacter mendelii TaxID=1908240 RepID=A0ABQ2BD68_9SPHI|nr:MarR family winged helix-turn-helix transcriptional regulator [Pedobacter mendelii]GGI23393.1 hypothetical protein GCM10008119_07420 [Pedobacter mendelii]